MRKYESQVGLLVVLLLMINPWTMDVQSHFFGLRLIFRGAPGLQIRAAQWVLLGWGLLSIVTMVRRRQPIQVLMNSTAWYVFATAIALFLSMLALNPIYAGKLQWLRLIFPLSVLFFTAKAFYLGFVLPSGGRLRRFLRPWATAAFGLFSALLLLECVFMFVARSSLNDNSLASKIWFARHWELTEDEFRESPALDEPDNNKPQLVLIGDSFLAGHGVKDPANRFSDRIQVKLGDRWQVHNHGQNGANVYHERSQMNGHEYEPKLVVLCWFVNDIQQDADDFGIRTGNEKLKAPFPISLIHGSYLMDFLAQRYPDQTAGENYLQFLQKAFTDSTVLQRHCHALQNISDYQHYLKRKFAVVLFPMMNLVDGSEFALRPMRDFWAQQQVPCLDLAPVFHPFTPEQLTVNASDAHPNEFAHELAADAIFSFLKANHLLDD